MHEVDRVANIFSPGQPGHPSLELVSTIIHSLRELFFIELAEGMDALGLFNRFKVENRSPNLSDTRTRHFGGPIQLRPAPANGPQECGDPAVSNLSAERERSSPRLARVLEAGFGRLENSQRAPETGPRCEPLT